MPNVSNQYRSPTCLLDIAAVSSPLSQWTERTVLKQVRFQVRLLPGEAADVETGEQAIVIRGDRAQLDALCSAIDLYVQQQLMDDQRFGSVSLTTDAHAENSLAPLLNIGSKLAVFQPINPHDSTITSHISLRPYGLLAHELVLGPLKSNTSSVIHLTMVQLSDLATVLDHYSKDILALPPLTERSFSLLPRAQWRAIAAVVILSVGTAGILTRMAYSPTPSLVGSNTSKPASQDQLGTSPDASQVPSRYSLEQSVLSKPSDGRLNTTAPSLEARAPLTIAVSPKSTSPYRIHTSFNPVPANSSQREDYRTFDQTQIAVAPSVLSGSNSTLEASSRMRNSSAPADVMPQSPLADRFDPQRVSNAPPVRSTDGFSSTQQSAAPSTSTVLLPSAEADIAPQPVAAPQPQSTLSLPGRREGSGSAPNGRGRSQPSQPFEPIPQLIEIKHYLEHTWQPLLGLTTSLEYVLHLQPDGSLQQVQPIGQRSADYLGISGIPSLGQPFTSPIASGRPLVVRVVLSPDGQVNVNEEISE